MANDVFANGREVSCKKADGKSIAAFPDVCMTPPTAPPTPPGVPIPYPNTAMAKDCAGGSKTVKISGAEVMLKNKSYVKTSTGDEAGSAPKKGVMTSKIKGKAYFKMWSMDVKFETANVVRHLDTTTHNHNCDPGQTAPWPYVDGGAVPPPGHPCEGVDPQLKLVPYKTGSDYTCAPKTGHHIIPGRCMRNVTGYDHSAAPVICVTGRSQYKEVHRKCHAFIDAIERFHFEHGESFTYERARYAAALSTAEATDPPGELTDKEVACVEAQLDEYYKRADPGPKVNDQDDLRTSGASGKANDIYDMVEAKLSE